ncbi:hypothetical protein TRFO_33999 [Tritrichomonas foetus]|uniref:DUF3447 domain-containing protein n=1 Tax=Tritrichomonas foetus TaxID=1144522 RepID=A0A1J4JM90_9EUKA|nr:hypothetical protein TRFO_33999 [Tritrichomonas foetus]|eukprot:OHS99543.1 hypothetical protein TRFO_33999 [Tritrichomonas foetus]
MLLIVTQMIHIKKKLMICLVFFSKIEISSNFMIYEAFVRLIASASSIRPSNSNHFIVINTILKELVDNHNLKGMFHSSTIFSIFKCSKICLLFLLEEGVINISFVENLLLNLPSNKRDLYVWFSFFFPEIKKANPEFYEMQAAKLCITEERIFQENHVKNIEEFYKARKLGHSVDEIAQIIQKDDLESFMTLVTKNENFNFNSTVENSIFENDNDVLSRKVYLVEYVMAFHSFNIFKYLLLNNVKFFQNSINFAIIGGNYEIIHILEEELNITFDLNNYFLSIRYHYPEIADYLLTTTNFGVSCKYFRQEFFRNNNYKYIYNLLKDPLKYDLILEDLSSIYYAQATNSTDLIFLLIHYILLNKIDEKYSMMDV